MSILQLTLRSSAQKQEDTLIIFWSIQSATPPLPDNFYSTKLLVAFWNY